MWKCLGATGKCRRQLFFFGGDDKCCKCQILSRDKQFKDDLAKMKEELGRRQEAKAEVSAAAES